MAIEEAKAKAEASMVDVVTSSALVDGNVGSAQWWLARVHPDRWGKKTVWKLRLIQVRRLRL